MARAVAVLGHRVEIRGTSPASLADVDAFDLVVVNSGDGRVDEHWDGDDERWAGHHDALHRYAAGGGPLLGLHQAAMTFADDARWRETLGGRWVPGLSMHPPWGPARFDVVADHAVVAGLRHVETLDERYARLEVGDGSRVLVDHEYEGRRHPVVWVNTTGSRRVVYDALGHDVRSYDSSSRMRLLANEVTWLLGAA